MYKAKVNKYSNRDRILECIYRNPRISRKEISDLTGITPATVTTTTAAMVKEGIITELGQMEEDRGTIGRSRIALDICPDHQCVVGVEFTVESMTVCATDLHGNILHTERIPYSPQLNENTSQLVAEQIRSCIAGLPVPEEKIAGIGIAVPGHMDSSCHRLISTNQFWSNFDGQALRQAFSCPVVFENNVRCMALHQYLHNPQQTPSSFALYHIGRGMFCANIADDELYIGTTYGSGEIAHTIAVPDGKRCECGKRGCLQTVATESALLENAAMIFNLREDSLLHNFASKAEDLTIEHICAVYSMGGMEVRRMVHQALQYLVMSALNIAILMNPEKLLIHGRLFNNEAIREDFMEMIQDKFEFTGNNYRLGTVDFIPCRDTDGAEGAAALAVLKCIIHA